LNINPPYGYQDIVPLAKTQRVQLQQARKLPAQFRGLSAFPLSFSEFTPAVRDYPAVFISGDAGKSFVAMILLGVEAQQNLFVDANDVWDATTYLPAYVRRHPFCMTRVSVNGQEQADRIACVEKNALQAKGTALFDDKGEPLPVWDGLRKLLFEFEADLGRSEEMARKMQELQLLEPFSAQALPNGEQAITLTGMYRVSEERLHALPAETLKELARNGVLARIYLHLLSLGNFQRLLDRRAARRNQEKPAPKVTTKKLN
jgi:hypothetical protein